MNLGKRLGTAFEMCGTTPPRVARASRVPVASINALLRRDSKRSEFTEQLLSVLPASRVNHEWVRTGQGTPEPTTGHSSVVSLKETSRPAEPPVEMRLKGEPAGLAEAPLRSWEHPTALPPGGWVFVPKLGIMYANPGKDMTITTVLMREEIQVFRTGWIRTDQLQPAALAWHDATDASMEPAICEGDSFVVDTSATDVHDGQTYAVWYGQALRPRKLFLLPTGGLRLAPLNPNFTTVDVPAHEVSGLKIIGRIVHRSGKGGL